MPSFYINKKGYLLLRNVLAYMAAFSSGMPASRKKPSHSCSWLPRAILGSFFRKAIPHVGSVTKL
jgi:hypothetical protein